MRAVVDTNILIRALIKPRGSVGPILGLLASNRYRLIYSLPLLDELAEKLALPRIRVKYNLDDQTIAATLALIALRGELVNPDRTVRVCRDPDDNALIDAALAGQAEYLVTGDQDLLVLRKFETVTIVQPHIFLAKIAA